MQIKKIVFYWIAGLVLSSSVYASGFQVGELTATQIGTVNAGTAAGNDITDSFYNPATLAGLTQPQVSAGTAVLFSRTQFSGEVKANTTLGESNTGTGKTGVHQAKGDTTSILPNLFIALPINQQLTFGLSAVSPFNWSNNYNRNTPLEWFTKENRLNAQVLSPSLAVQINPQLAFAAGLDATRVYASYTHFSNEHYFDTEDSSDNESHTHVDGSGYGWHAGVLFQPTSKTRIGLGYRSQVVAHLNGSSKFSGIDAIDTLNYGVITDDAAKMDLTLPPLTTLSISQILNERFTVLGTVSYTQWSKTSGLTLQNVLATVQGDMGAQMEPALSNNTLLPSLRDTLSISLGTSMKMNDKCLVRAGFGYDQSSIPNSRNRSPYLPDADTYNLGLGSHYQFNRNFGMDLAWKHIFINKAGSDSFETSDSFQTSSIVDGTSTNFADIVGLQMQWTFA